MPGAGPTADGGEAQEHKVPVVLMAISIGVLVIGLAVAVAGLLLGGPDEAKQQDLNTQVAVAQQDLTAAQADLADASATLTDTTAGAEAVKSDAQAITDLAADICDCNTGVNDRVAALNQAVKTAIASQSQADFDAGDAAINEANTELNRLQTLNIQLRVEMIDRAPVPEGPSDDGT